MRHSLDPGLVDQLADARSRNALLLGSLGDLVGDHRLGRFQRGKQARALGIRFFIEAEPPARVAFTGQQDGIEAPGFAERVAAPPPAGCMR